MIRYIYFDVLKIDLSSKLLSTDLLTNNHDIHFRSSLL